MHRCPLLATATGYIVLCGSTGAKDLAQDAHDDVHRHCEVDVNETVGGHGHSHAALPNSVAQVAWMVIMGDGIHNFGDGLAIGTVKQPNAASVTILCVYIFTSKFSGQYQLHLFSLPCSQSSCV